MGLLDGVIPELVSEVLELIVDEPIEFVRQENVYDPVAMVDTQVVRGTVSARATPPAPFDTKIVDGKDILGTDLECYAEAKPMTDAGFDPEATSRVLVFATYRGDLYSVVKSKPVLSGDEIAMYQLQLRK